MKLDTPRLLLLAIATAVAGGVAAVSGSRRRKQRTARMDDHHSQIGSWENEGGTPTPVVTPADAGAAPTYRAVTRPSMYASFALSRRNDRTGLSNASLTQRQHHAT